MDQEAGASGLLLKDSPAADLIAAIQAVILAYECGLVPREGQGLR
jgi:DNA-binding NarL/FixJ family response regulator